ncbi:MAG TPA: hypothetical protein VK447_12995 [Myxococcaceae bacterium]|nr:hypothetical protein [Myxococcaceae bacterium]
MLLAAGLTVPFCFAVIRESDAGFHLALGRLFATEGLQFRNALSWTAPDYPWYPASYLYDLVAWKLTVALGPLGFQLWTAALWLLALALLAGACAELDAWGAWMVPGVALLLLPRVTERPHLVSWCVLGAVLWLGIAARTRGWGWKARLLAVPVVALGSNFHAGAIFGTGVLGLFCLEALLRERAGRWREVAIGLGGVLAVLANPGGVFTVTYAADHLLVRRVVEIQEFLPPRFTQDWPFFFLVPLAVLATAMRWREWPSLLAAVVVFAALGFHARREMSDFYLLAAVGLSSGLAALRQRWAGAGKAVVVGLPLLLLGGGFFGAEVLARARALRIAPEFDPTQLPVRAAAFARSEGITGRLVNSFRDGGYLEYALEQPAFLDGRIFAWPAEFFSQLQSAEADRGRYQAWMRELGAEWAIATRRVERLGGFRLFHASPDWALVYWDGLNEVFLRRDVPRFAPIIAKAEYRYFRPYGSILGNVVSTAPGRAARVRRRGGAVRTHLPGRSVRRAGALRARPADGRGRGRVRPGPAARHHAAAARAGTAGRLGASRGRAVGLSRAAPAVRAAPPSARWA